MRVNRHRTIILAAVIFLVGLSAACTPFMPETRSPEEERLSEQFSLYSGDAAPTDRWWEHFGAKDLTALVDEALSDNFGIREAWARLQQAQARAIQAGADRYPSLDATAGLTVGQQRADTGGPLTWRTPRWDWPVDTSWISGAAFDPSARRP